jgi:hypothetical protein
MRGFIVSGEEIPRVLRGLDANVQLVQGVGMPQ